MLQTFERRTDSVVNVARGPKPNPRGGESRVVAQHTIGLGAVIARRPVRLNGQRGRHGERKHQQQRDHGATSHPETSHGLKIPFWTPTATVPQLDWTVL
jgi:hypothetical protein